MDSATVYGLFLLLANSVFIALYLWVYSKKNKVKFERAAHIPFDDEGRGSDE
jgi:cbb3-type cytochrome oxidase subunit 3